MYFAKNMNLFVYNFKAQFYAEFADLFAEIYQVEYFAKYTMRKNSFITKTLITIILTALLHHTFKKRK